MRGKGIQAGMAVVFWFVLHQGLTQHLVWQDTVRVLELGCLADSGNTLVRATVIQHVEYAFTLSAACFFNRDHDPGTNQFLLLQDLNYRCRLKTTRRFTMDQQIVHHLGLQYLFDSITRVQPDDNKWESRFEWEIRKNHGIFLSSVLCTRLFKGYDYSSNASGSPVRILNSSFLTPFTALFSGGVQFRWPRFGSLNLGITSMKLVSLRDKGIYEARQTTICFGVPSDKKGLLEYGLSLQLLIDHAFTRWLHWNCDMLLFKSTDLAPDFSLKNHFGFRITKFLKARIQTRIFYEERISKQVQVENILSLGFAVTL